MENKIIEFAIYKLRGDCERARKLLKACLKASKKMIEKCEKEIDELRELIEKGSEDIEELKNDLVTTKLLLREKYKPEFGTWIYIHNNYDELNESRLINIIKKEKYFW